jgi:hypothetical protein
VSLHPFFCPGDHSHDDERYIDRIIEARLCEYFAQKTAFIQSGIMNGNPVAVETVGHKIMLQVPEVNGTGDQ